MGDWFPPSRKMPERAMGKLISEEIRDKIFFIIVAMLLIKFHS